MPKDKTLSSEDRILWGKVARSTRALPGRLDALTEFEEAFAQKPAAEKQPEPEPKKKKKSVQVDEGIALTTIGRDKETRHHPLERPVKRKIAKGRLALEARIDLHGMVQSEAHGFLLGFLIRAHERGLRHVLVITGKGTSLGSDGALKRAVPLWFSLPEFRPLISSYEPAARNHGGDGALYVRLARHPGDKR
ncbi:Smr/MutS family protein [Shinella sp. JR1-6]|jgi:DNA-nicking Smr family endonuclease|uniref:Smr/MutS family protein n=1 Tax=Shinella sp. JR1-6 TaxID=2527671 RepID=UPI00102D641E|nr:Smr/MutS family protein [Shinella sp. JR1-6]TAA57108.1 DNA mismatch repair protein MutS [Shinella sp. JR1-6]